jgi:acylphosphatase
MSTIGPLTRRHLAVRGHVQGVGFRWFTRQTAETLGLTGWVRNREDGSVEAEAEGTERALEEFVKRLRDGNPAAHVDSIEVRQVAARGDHGFMIK